MAPKRKSDAMELPPVVVLADSDSLSTKENDPAVDVAPIFKKTRVLDVADDSSSSTANGKGKVKKADQSKPLTWRDVKLEGEDEGSVPVYDDCGEVRRKIRLLQKTQGWKVTHWLRDIGGINSNSFSRFMKETGKNDGATNGTYYAGYIYFEKVRIAEGKKKTAKRLSNEATHLGGFPLENRRKGWFLK